VIKENNKEEKDVHKICYSFISNQKKQEWTVGSCHDFLAMVSCAPFRNEMKEQGVGGEKWAETKNAAVPKILCEVNALVF
jgi:hypothetical protein